jgi:hypothetical protein
LKDHYPQINELKPSDVADFRFKGKGPYSFFSDLLNNITSTGKSRLAIEAKEIAHHAE